jgi:hypothetical protein
MQEDHHEALQRELGVELAKDDEEDEEEHNGGCQPILACRQPVISRAGEWV